LLASCETFQKGMDDMSDKQNNFDTQIKIVNDNVDEYKAENDDLKEEIETLGDKFSSLLLEYEVDKGSLKSQMENLMFNVSVLTTKLPMDTFAFSKESSTSGITSGLKSTDSSEMDTVSTPPPALSSPPPPSADSVKKIVSQLVFSNEAAAAADPKLHSVSPKVAEKPPSKPEPGGKPRKVLYNSGAVNHIPQGPPYPAITVPGNTNLWMSPDGGMVAIPPPTGPPVSTGSGSLSTRPPVPLPWPRGAMGQPYAGAPMMYPFNYPAVFYGPPR